MPNINSSSIKNGTSVTVGIAEKIINSTPGAQKVYDAVASDKALKTYSDAVTAQMQGLIKAGEQTTPQELFQNRLAVVLGRIERITTLLKEAKIPPEEVGLKEGTLENYVQTLKCSLNPGEGELKFTELDEKIHNIHRILVKRLRERDKATLINNSIAAQNRSNNGKLGALKRTENECANLEKDIASKKIQITNLEQKLQGAEAKAKKLKEDLEAATKEVTNLEKQIADCEARIEQIRNAQKQSMQEIQAAQVNPKENKGLKDEIANRESLQKELTEAEQKCADLEKQFQQAKNKKEELKAQSKEQEEQLETLKNKKNETEKEVRTLEKQLESENTKIEELSGKLNESLDEEDFLKP